MLNRTPGTARSAEELAAEDRRIEIAAARETALAMALRAGAGGRAENWTPNIDAVVLTAGAFEAFLLRNQANGQNALETALTLVARHTTPNAIDALQIADRFCRYLDTGNVDEA
jgi:hypothetical protein